MSAPRIYQKGKPEHSTCSDEDWTTRRSLEEEEPTAATEVVVELSGLEEPEGISFSKIPRKNKRNRPELRGMEMNQCDDFHTGKASTERNSAKFYSEIISLSLMLLIHEQLHQQSNSQPTEKNQQNKKRNFSPGKLKDR